MLYLCFEAGIDWSFEKYVLMDEWQPTMEVSEDEFEKVFAVNVKSIFHVSIPSFHGLLLSLTQI